jgi:glyoxylase-like metal-dependent hydrolase (beta-lactamase superfamily II)
MTVGIMQVTDNLHAFIWKSHTENNCNTYLINGTTPILLDPGHVHLFDHVLRSLDTVDLALDDLGVILCTHAHPDHIEAVEKNIPSSALIAIHQADWEMVRAMEPQLLGMGLRLENVNPDFFVTEGTLDIGGTRLQVFHTPGHSPGSVCYYWPHHKVLFTGDLIFKEGLGRTDLPGGSSTQLKESILRMAALDIEWILPGHGEIIQGADAVRRNFEQLESFYFMYI